MDESYLEEEIFSNSWSQYGNYDLLAHTYQKNVTPGQRLCIKTKLDSYTFDYGIKYARPQPGLQRPVTSLTVCDVANCGWRHHRWTSHNNKQLPSYQVGAQSDAWQKLVFHFVQVSHFLLINCPISLFVDYFHLVSKAALFRHKQTALFRQKQTAVFRHKQTALLCHKQHNKQSALFLPHPAYHRDVEQSTDWFVVTELEVGVGTVFDEIDGFNWLLFW